MKKDGFPKAAIFFAGVVIILQWESLENTQKFAYGRQFTYIMMSTRCTTKDEMKEIKSVKNYERHYATKQNVE